jgi:hypothetical protein
MDIQKIPGAALFASLAMESMPPDFYRIVIGDDPSRYALVKTNVHRNLYRIPIQ